MSAEVLAERQERLKAAYQAVETGIGGLQQKLQGLLVGEQQAAFSQFIRDMQSKGLEGPSLVTAAFQFRDLQEQIRATTEEREKMDKLRQAGERVRADVVTPYQTMRDSQAELNRLQEKGLITQEQYAKALKKTADIYGGDLLKLSRQWSNDAATFGMGARQKQIADAMRSATEGGMNPRIAAAWANRLGQQAAGLGQQERAAEAKKLDPVEQFRRRLSETTLMWREGADSTVIGRENRSLLQSTVEAMTRDASALQSPGAMSAGSQAAYSAIVKAQNRMNDPKAEAAKQAVAILRQVATDIGRLSRAELVQVAETSR
jgi:hypothetical protein